jgi:hypothetical protein
MTSIIEAAVVETTLDTPVVVDSRLFTDRVTAAAITMISDGLRNLNNPDLIAFHVPTEVPFATVEEKFLVDAAKRNELGLEAISSQDFVNQLSSQNSTLFVSVLTAAGLELTLEDDIRSDTELGANITPVGQITPENVRIRLQNRSKTSTDHLHLIEKAPPVLADTDKDVQDRINRIKNYLRDYIK